MIQHWLQKKSIKLILKSIMKSCLSWHYNGANSYLFVNGAEIHKFKAGYTEVNPIPLYLGNSWKYYFVGNMKQTGFYGYAFDFSVDYDPVTVDDILDIHKYLI